jgi:hypothetical protein
VCHRTVRCSKRTKGSNGQQLQTPMGAHRTVNSDYPVRHRTIRCAHRQQKQPTTRKWLGAINTTQPPHSKPSKYSELPIQYKGNSIHSKTQFQRSNPLQVPKSTQPLSDLRERESLCVHLSSCCLDCLLSFPFLFLSVCKASKRQLSVWCSLRGLSDPFD